MKTFFSYSSIQHTKKQKLQKKEAKRNKNKN